jgi:hypothetical protein
MSAASSAPLRGLFMKLSTFAVVRALTIEVLNLDAAFRPRT